ncbi:hypothetical protein GW17_00013475 [Ensete ventricosum]|nr:hypothetical protein GW17_00013475 [Ensete ventricosum]
MGDRPYMQSNCGWSSLQAIAPARGLRTGGLPAGSLLTSTTFMTKFPNSICIDVALLCLVFLLRCHYPSTVALEGEKDVGETTTTTPCLNPRTIASCSGMEDLRKGAGCKKVGEIVSELDEEATCFEFSSFSPRVNDMYILATMA